MAADLTDKRIRDPSIWFPAKTVGWGWGPPVTWQGWVVTAVYVIAMTVAAVNIAPVEHPWLFAVATLAMTMGFLGVCYAKGEKPGWRSRGSENN